MNFHLVGEISTLVNIHLIVHYFDPNYLFKP